MANLPIVQKHPIDYHHVTNLGDWKFCACASSLGIRAGRAMPQEIDTCMGNGQPFIFTGTQRDGEGDIQSWTYRQSLGVLHLTIFND